MSNVITLYDIPADSIPGKSWSPNCWKTRFSLNYKGLQYKTVWVEYPDVAETLEGAGIPAAFKRPDGTPLYTCPAIFDPATNTGISDSVLIAEYLDKQYPDTPKLFPAGSHALQYAFLDNFAAKIVPLFRFIIPGTHGKLNEHSQGYFRRTREVAFGRTMETMVPTGADRDEEWGKIKAAFDKFDQWLQTSRTDGPYFVGKDQGFADFVLASFILWMKLIWGEQSAEWKDVATWNEGRWVKYLDSVQKYQTIV